ncbi:hypothetical protein Bcep22_gp38 [Burkholderia phage Bcep22]|uniref:Uncharacterized protein n=1 Tax=Burkholderia phage Bcep22 TaxID=2883944 RepID=Q6V7Q5_9CAUD|nr:hypothetical protein Bcep22_gp38 [Burkholderia phage Bcep22]AAQ54971.1 hypothetical protein Bcep22_gp38 [Burkholderia phage Bcep22]
MALTPEKREALKLARERIAKRQSRYICFALEEVERLHPALAAACAALLNYIESQIGDQYTSLETWQRRNGFRARTSAQTRLDRLAWIDWMLDEPKEAR